MIKKSISFIVVLLMISPAFSFLWMTPQLTTVSTQSIESNFEQAETDLGRVDWTDNMYPNKGFETWSNPNYPLGLFTSRTTEEATWIETTIVNQGAQSLGMHVRAIDSSHWSEVEVHQTFQPLIANPINMTLSFDWYLDSIGTPIDVDYVMLRIRMSSRSMYYYMGCERTAVTNGTSAYFMIDEPLQTWNTLDRNLTADYIEVFSETPTQFTNMEWFIRSYTYVHTRVYMDDVVLLNGTDLRVDNGGFESGKTDWFTTSSYDPGDISQSSVAYDGDYSMNMTAISYNYSAYARAGANIGKLLSEDNEGQLSFWWRIDDWVNPTSMNYARMQISAANETTNFNMYYYFCRGGDGSLPPVIFGNDMKFAAAGFNTTDTWNHFERNIWDDFHTIYSTENLYIGQIFFYVWTDEDDSRLSILIDEVELETSILNDMDYENQNDIGSMIQGWSEPETDPIMTVTDFAKYGAKAANLTIENDIQSYVEQDMGSLPINSSTELIFDFWVYIDEFNESSYDFIYFELYFDDTSIAYVIANSTSYFENEISEELNFIILLEEVITGEWLNFQLDIVHDYELLTGSLPDDIFYDINFKAEAGVNSRLSVLFDDMYIYYDPAPTVTNVIYDPPLPQGGDSVLISAEVVDATIDTVVLTFRIDGGSWSDLEMNRESDNTWADEILDLNAGSVVEFSITATDAFGKSTTALNGTGYFQFTVYGSTTSTTTEPPIDLLPVIVAGVAIVGIVAIVVLYMFVYKKE